MCGFCVDDQIVIVPLPGSKCATTPRGSIAFGTRRWLTMRCEMTTSASANALSIGAVVHGCAVGADARCRSARAATARLFGNSRMNDRRLAGHRQLGIHDRRQRIVGDDDGVGGIARDVSIARQRRPRPARRRTGPCRRRRRDAAARGTACRSASAPGARRSAAPVNTASTPSIASAALVSIDTMRPCAMSLRLNAMCCMPTIFTSSTKVPRPWIRRGSSRRLTR